MSHKKNEEPKQPKQAESVEGLGSDRGKINVKYVKIKKKSTSTLRTFEDFECFLYR